MRKIWKISDGATHWYSAETIKEALQFHLKTLGCKTVSEYFTDYGPTKTEEMEDAYPLTVEIDGNKVTTKTCAEWAKETDGLVATTEH